MSLEIWTVYENPRDYPGMFVARKFILDKPTDDVQVAPTLEGLRDRLPSGLTCLTRHPTDDPCIVETWL